MAVKRTQVPGIAQTGFGVAILAEIYAHAFKFRGLIGKFI